MTVYFSRIGNIFVNYYLFWDLGFSWQWRLFVCMAKCWGLLKFIVIAFLCILLIYLDLKVWSLETHVTSFQLKPGRNGARSVHAPRYAYCS